MQKANRYKIKKNKKDKVQKKGTNRLSCTMLAILCPYI